MAFTRIVCAILFIAFIGSAFFGEDQNREDSESAHGRVAKAAVGAVVGAGAVVIGAALLLRLLGFSTAGVVAGSIAAGIQSFFYGGAVTGVFSAFQSAGVVGVGYVAPAIGGGLGAAGTGYFSGNWSSNLFAIRYSYFTNFTIDRYFKIFWDALA